MAESPTLHSSRLRIVPFSERYLTEEYVGWLNDPEIVRYSEQRHYRHSLASCRDYYESFKGTSNYFWALQTAGKGEHIGNMNAYVDAANGVADVGILIGKRSFQGQGYGFEAWSAVCTYLLEERGMRKVTAGTLASNAGMVRIMRKAGMIEDGVRRRQCVVDGKEVDIVHYALFKDRGGALS